MTLKFFLLTSLYPQFCCRSVLSLVISQFQLPVASVLMILSSLSKKESASSVLVNRKCLFFCKYGKCKVPSRCFEVALKRQEAEYVN